MCHCGCCIAVLQERAASPVLNLFGGGGTRKVESLATQVERQVESQRTRRGTQVRGTQGCQPWLQQNLHGSV